MSLAKRIGARVRWIERTARVSRPVDLAVSRCWAEALRRGCVLFFGNREVEVGLADIDWSGSHVANQEWPSQLNRFLWLEHVAAVYQETGDETWPALARTMIEDWIATHDYRTAERFQPGDNGLSVAIRLGRTNHPGWWGTLAAFARSPHYDDAFVGRMIDSTATQLELLERRLSPAGNWRLSQLDCLLYCSQTVPGVESHAPAAARRLSQEFRLQVHDDGSHIEHCPGYHRYVCEQFTAWWRIGRAIPALGLRLDAGRLARMWDYWLCSLTPDGGSCGLHDIEAWVPGAGYGSVAEKRSDFLREAELGECPEFDLAARPSRWFPDAGQLFLRDDWSETSDFLLFDASRWGGGHCHLSRLAISLFSGGRMLLCDPGSFSYEMSDPYAIYGKSTSAHNTVALGNLNQSDANPETYCVHLGRETSWIASRYAGGYWPGRYAWRWQEGKGTGVYGCHDRLMVWIRGRGALVFDMIETDGKGQSYAARWQFHEGAYALDAARLEACSANAHATNILVKCLFGSDPVTPVVRKGETNPLAGWLPVDRGSDRYEPAPMASFEATAFAPVACMVFLLLPFQGEAPPSPCIEPLSADRELPGFAFRCDWGDGIEDIVACRPRLDRMIGDMGPLTCDGRAAHVRLRRATVENAFILDGARLELNEKPLIVATEPGTHECRFDAT